MRTSLLVCSALLLSICFAIRLPAADIAWISFHSTNLASAAAMGATPPHTDAPDKAYTDVLTGAGHTVTRFLSSGTPNTAVLNDFDLVIISRSVPSGDYETDPETAAWNGLTVPMIITGGYVLRNNRLGFTTGGTIPDTTAPVNLTVNNPSHPIFAGIALGAANTTVNPYAGIVTFNGSLQRGVSVNTNPVAGGRNRPGDHRYAGRSCRRRHGHRRVGGRIGAGHYAARYVGRPTAGFPHRLPGGGGLVVGDGGTV